MRYHLGHYKVIKKFVPWRIRSKNGLVYPYSARLTGVTRFPVSVCCCLAPVTLIGTCLSFHACLSLLDRIAAHWISPFFRRVTVSSLVRIICARCNLGLSYANCPLGSGFGCCCLDSTRRIGRFPRPQCTSLSSNGKITRI